MKSTRRSFVNGAAAASLVFTVLNGMPLPANAQSVTPEEAGQIADGRIYLRLLAHHDRGHARPDEQCAEG